MTRRCGVILCACRSNLEPPLDLRGLGDRLRALEGVARVSVVDAACAPQGRAEMTEMVRSCKLDGWVVAGCSPAEHEETFRRAAAAGGLNPFCVHVANIREQCAWVTPDPPAATDKAFHLVHAAVQRLAHHRPLERRVIDCRTEVLVVGAGVAGLQATLALADAGRQVHLLERESWLGGNAVRFESLEPSFECGACVISPLLDRVLHHERVEVLTAAEVTAVAGFPGNYRISVTQRARGIDGDACVGCGQCAEACPVRVRVTDAGRDAERRAVGLPFPGALPNVPTIDAEHCRNAHGQACDACRCACPFGAVTLAVEPGQRDLDVGAVVLATGFSQNVVDGRLPLEGAGAPDVLTGLELERLLAVDGPTGGVTVPSDGKPARRVALIRTEALPADGGSRWTDRADLCRRYTAKFARQIRELAPEARIVEIAAAASAALSGEDPETSVETVRVVPGGVRGIQRGDRGLTICAESPGGGSIEILADLVVLGVPLAGAAGNAELAACFDVPTDGQGFFQGRDELLTPTSNHKGGVVIAGSARGPMGVTESAVDGLAAAAVVLSRFPPGHTVELEAAVAECSTDRCSGCGACSLTCAHGAVGVDPSTGKAGVNEVLCRGCGSCVAGCPAGAMRQHHFSDEALLAEVRGLLG